MNYCLQRITSALQNTEIVCQNAEIFKAVNVLKIHVCDFALDLDQLQVNKKGCSSLTTGLETFFMPNTESTDTINMIYR